MSTPAPTFAELRENLTQAIAAVAAHTSPAGTTLIDYVVVTAEYRAVNDGSESCIMGWLGAEQQPTYRAVGLLEWARESMAAKYEAESEE